MSEIEIISADVLKRELVQGLSLEIIKRVNEKLKIAASQGENSVYIDFGEMPIKPTQIDSLNAELSRAGYIVIPGDVGVIVEW